jgi:ribosomal protein S6--L-glutamate ligase
MILSYHPLYEGDQHRLCAGRDPDRDDLAAMRKADAVILPQGCRASLYQAARQCCARVFPDYDARFAYPGKIGQMRLFQQMAVPHPLSYCYTDTRAFFRHQPNGILPLSPPAVLKLDWGGEGDGVFPLMTNEEMTTLIERLRSYESTGQSGFIVQQWIPADARSLRVVVTGHEMVSYWRTMPAEASPLACLAKGGRIDRASDPHLISAAESATASFCRKTGINLAGFDFLFSTDPSVADPRSPLFLEINYFFGRRGLQGSDAYYRRLMKAIAYWLQKGAVVPRPSERKSSP